MTVVDIGSWFPDINFINNRALQLLIINKGFSVLHVMISIIDILFSFDMLWPIFFVPRKMQVSGATDLASKGQGLSDSSNVKLKEEFEDSYNDMKIRCPCGSTLPTETMLKVYQLFAFFFLSCPIFTPILGGCVLLHIGQMRMFFDGKMILCMNSILSM